MVPWWLIEVFHIGTPSENTTSEGFRSALSQRTPSVQSHPTSSPISFGPSTPVQSASAAPALVHRPEEVRMYGLPLHGFCGAMVLSMESQTSLAVARSKSLEEGGFGIPVSTMSRILNQDSDNLMPYLTTTLHKIQSVLGHSDASEIQQIPVEVGSLSHYLQGFRHPNRLFGSSEPSTEKTSEVSSGVLDARRPCIQYILPVPKGIKNS